MDLFDNSSAQLHELQQMHLIHASLAVYRAGQEHAVQPLQQSVVFFPVIPLVLGFSHSWDGDNSETRSSGGETSF